MKTRRDRRTWEGWLWYVFKEVTLYHTHSLDGSGGYPAMLLRQNWAGSLAPRGGLVLAWGVVARGGLFPVVIDTQTLNECVCDGLNNGHNVTRRIQVKRYVMDFKHWLASFL